MSRRIIRPAAALAAMLIGGSLSAAPAVGHRSDIVGPGESIQAAVDAADAGDTIVVTGVHREMVVIQTDGLTLLGRGAVLLPPKTPTPSACFDPTVEGEAVHGICLFGDIDVDTGEVFGYVEHVTVKGFTVRGFAGSGLVAAAASDAAFVGNTLRNNKDSGVGVANSIHTRIFGNRMSGNEFGIFSSFSERGRIVANTSRANCVGALLLGDVRSQLFANHLTRNSQACPPGGDFPALSGIGVALVSVTDSVVAGNRITHNVASGETLFAGGVVVAQDASDNAVVHNLVLRNDPDLLTDGTGVGNRFRGNICRSSVPSSLCS